MPDLIAQGPEPDERWRRALMPGRAFVVGRAAEWGVDWDASISRRHAEVMYRDGELTVRRLADARNPVFYRGRAVEQATIAPREHFVIGQTTFTFVDEHVDVTLDAPSPDVQEAFTVAELKRLRFRDAQSRIGILSRLPELIAGAPHELELHARVVNVLLSGVPTAAAAALIVAEPATAPPAPIRVLHWDRRRHDEKPWAPSRRLVLEAVRRGESLLHVWNVGGQGEFTATADADWALATPLAGDACRGWALYVEGRFGGAHGGAEPDLAPLREDLKFTEVVAAAVASWRENERLRQLQAGLRPFFSPQVLDAIARDGPEQVLAPRETRVSVLFCDLRGFTRASERAAQELMALLRRVSDALGVATEQIREHEGVVGDFHGDAVMGFWGWPLPSPRPALSACAAAIAIQNRFAASARSQPLADFRIGIGIATGVAVAGRIGTADQAKVTVFGPVVNLAARLESMTRQLGADILIDEATAADVADEAGELDVRLRSLLRVQPAGMETSLTATELLPAGGEHGSAPPAWFDAYATALEHFNGGRWPQARALLGDVAGSDPVARFLLEYVDRHGPDAPSDWDGVVRLTAK